MDVTTAAWGAAGADVESTAAVRARRLWAAPMGVGGGGAAATPCTCSGKMKEGHLCGGVE